MLCGSTGQANPLNYCADGTVLHIGEVQTDYDFGGTDLAVLFTELATGTKTLIDAVATYSDISIVIDGFEPTTGHKYLVTLHGRASTGSLTQLPFLPYEYDSTTHDYDASATAVDGLYVGFVKVHDQSGQVTGSTDEQWVSLA